MALDLVIKNGTVVDGTGRERYRADVGVADGRIAEIGKVKDGAKRVIDASDLIVAPGFFDPHTHYDAQICWDPLVTCSSWHGVTSVVMGNCGVGIAPCQSADARNRHLGPGQRRRNPVRGSVQGHDLGLAELSRVHGRGGKARQRAEPRLSGPADALSPLRDGRGVDGTGGATGGNRPDQGDDQGGGRGRRSRLFAYPAAPAYRLSGPSAGLPPRQSRRTQGYANALQELGRARSRSRSARKSTRFPKRRPNCSTCC